MKYNLLILLGVCLFGLQANANVGGWKLVSASKSATATSQEDIQKLILANPELLQNELREKAAVLLSGSGEDSITELRVKRRKYRWEGKTQCPKGDPRLFSEVVFADALQWKSGGMALMVSGEEVPENIDPCTVAN